MKTVKIVHTADLHIGAAESFLGAGADKRRFETLLTFERIVELASENGAKIIAIAGDLFDSNNIEPRFVDAVFAKIAAASPVKVVFAAGNHDPLNSNSPFLTRDLPQNLYVLGVNDECITFEDINVKVYGRSFDNSYLKGEERFTLETDPQYINILVQHGELTNDIGSDYNAITKTFIENSGMDYIALGHVHKKTDIGKIGRTFIAYCGCPEGQGFDELDEKGVYIGEIGKDSCSLEFVSVSRRKHIHQKVDITGLGDSKTICEKIISQLQSNYGDSFSENLYKIELVGETPYEAELDTTEILSRLAAEVYFVKIKDNTEISLDLEALSAETSLKGIFVRKTLERLSAASEEEKPLYKKALKLGLKAFKAEVKYNED